MTDEPRTLPEQQDARAAVLAAALEDIHAGYGDQRPY
jgi:hypothetical protein